MAKKKGGILKFIVELFIVFIGVYGAFELNRYQDGMRERAIRDNYFTSFKSELEGLNSDILNTLNTVDQKLKAIEDSSSIPEPLNLYLATEMLITKAGFNDDIFVQLGSGITSSLSGGFESVKTLDRMIQDFNLRCSYHLISSSPIGFYDAQGNLKDQFNWYLKDLKRIKVQCEQLASMLSNEALPSIRSIANAHR